MSALYSEELIMQTVTTIGLDAARRESNGLSFRKATGECRFKLSENSASAIC